jgi:chaperonin GroEL
MAKIAVIGYEGRDKLVKGANFVADAVKKTMGPGGQNYALEKGNKITNDGITVAREISDAIQDEIEERGAKLLLQAINKANDEAGDGSTTVTVLAQAILKACIPKLPSKDKLVGQYTPMQLIKKVESEYQEVKTALMQMAKPVESEQEMIEVATVSVENEELGNLIGQTQWELGKDGYILAEETNERTSSIERVKGLYLDNGFGSSFLINNPEKEALELFNVHVIYTNNTISSLDPLKPVIESLIKMGHKQIVIMARAFTNEAIQACLKNIETGLGLYPLNAPYTDQAEVMYDLQAIIGGRFINVDSESIDSLQVSDVGYATHVLAKRSSTVFAGKGEKVEQRVETLEKKKTGTGSDFEKRNLSSRIAQLTNGFAILKIGAQTETERKYLKDKADDAVNAARAALQEGVIPGAGQALKDIAETLPDDYIIKNALRAPYEQIRANAGDDLVVPEWVKDSVKVTRIALEKACSIAPILATANGAIATKKPTELETLLKRND